MVRQRPDSYAQGRRASSHSSVHDHYSRNPSALALHVAKGRSFQFVASQGYPCGDILRILGGLALVQDQVWNKESSYSVGSTVRLSQTPRERGLSLAQSAP